MRTLAISFLLVICSLPGSVSSQSKAQDSLLLDSSLKQLAQCVKTPHREQVEQFRSSVMRSGVLFRMDSLNATRVFIEGSGHDGNYYFTEYYYKSDSIPFAVFERSSFRTSDVFTFFSSWETYTDLITQNARVDHRQSQFIRTYRRGCIRYSRLNCHRIMKQMIRSYKFKVSIDRPAKKVYSNVSIPPKHKLFILHFKGGGF